MERIDKILQAEVEIKDKETPEHIIPSLLSTTDPPIP